MAVAQFAPLCIVKLVLKLRVQKHLVDKERVTLRLWLRAVKVKLDVAVEFWSQHVNEKDARAPMAHVYAKSYACVGCPKIRAQGLCPFQDSAKSIVSWSTEAMPSAALDIEDIVARTQCPSERCAGFFALRHGAGMRTGPRNPALYFARAVEAGLQ
jgi:DNA primase large subunit